MRGTGKLLVVRRTAASVVEPSTKLSQVRGKTWVPTRHTWSTTTAWNSPVIARKAASIDDDAETAGSRWRRRKCKGRFPLHSTKGCQCRSSLSAMNCLGGRPYRCNPLWPLHLTATTLSSLSSSLQTVCRSHFFLLVLALISLNYTPLISRLQTFDGVQALSIISAKLRFVDVKNFRSHAVFDRYYSGNIPAAVISLTLYSAVAIIVPHRIIWSWYTGRWWMGCYI